MEAAGMTGGFGVKTGMRVCLCVLQDQIHHFSVLEVGVNLSDSTRGFPKWSGIKTCERNDWVHRDA